MVPNGELRDENKVVAINTDEVELMDHLLYGKAPTGLAAILGEGHTTVIATGDSLEPGKTNKVSIDILEEEE